MIQDFVVPLYELRKLSNVIEIWKGNPWKCEGKQYWQRIGNGFPNCVAE